MCCDAVSVFGVPSRFDHVAVISPLTRRILVHRPVFALQVNERGRATEDREEQRKPNGAMHEETPPKQHRKPERTLRYRRTSSPQIWFSGHTGDSLLT